MTTKVLVTMNGQPVITAEDFAFEKERIVAANPDLKQPHIAKHWPQIEKQIIRALLNQILIKRYITDSDIFSSALYQKELQEGYKTIERIVNEQFFMYSLNLRNAITEEQVRAFYEAHKNTLPQGIVPEGIPAEEVTFEQVKDKIKTGLERELYEKKAQEKIIELETKYNIEINNDLLHREE